jgi:hypothetical protein
MGFCHKASYGRRGMAGTQSREAGNLRGQVRKLNSALRLDPDADELGVLQHLQMLRHG